LVYVLSLSILSHTIFFFFIHTSTTEIYTLSLHDALPIYPILDLKFNVTNDAQLWTDEEIDRLIEDYVQAANIAWDMGADKPVNRSEEHTSELQSRGHLVCRLLLEKKKRLKIAAG